MKFLGDVALSKPVTGEVNWVGHTGAMGGGHVGAAAAPVGNITRKSGIVLTIVCPVLTIVAFVTVSTRQHVGGFDELFVDSIKSNYPHFQPATDSRMSGPKLAAPVASPAVCGQRAHLLDIELVYSLVPYSTLIPNSIGISVALIARIPCKDCVIKPPLVT